MPRKSKAPGTPKRLAQKKLDVFFSSSPAPGPSVHSSPTRPRRTRKRKRTRDASPENDNAPGPSQVPEEDEGSQSSDAGAIRFEREVVEVSSSDSEKDIAPRPSLASKGKKRLRRAHSDESISPIPLDRDEEEVFVRKGKRAAAKMPATVLDSDDELEELQPRRRKLVKGERPSSPVEDEADLLDEVDEERIIEPRLRARDKRSAFQKNLEKLKRRKRGESVHSESSASGSEDDDIAQPFSGAKPHRGSGEDSDDDGGDNAEEDDTFIVEDDSAAAIELPAEFSMNTYQDLLHHFKIVCQLFVHMAVHDSDDRSDVATRLQRNQYFSVPLQITRRKLSGMRDSLVAGSTWRPNFRKALDTYPVLEVYSLEFTVLGCAACNLGGRKSTLQGRLSGEPYDKLTFESIAEEETSSDEEDESKKLPKQFDLGRFCAKRTRTYHQFTHWEYHLFHALKDEVEGLKGMREGRSFVRVAYAAGKQPPEDLTDADAIMDWLDERQVINLQWHEIKNMMESARHLEVKGGRGGDFDSD
ncbi:hypothetical protein BV20DRAFT_1118198 [Pilatotrama ljubarskyi]|nr:hypothetical protein BV20DRAFT_1118198 [Pilatotrama ljubarskyi]